jgi:phosphate transport system substrate-binding protein
MPNSSPHGLDDLIAGRADVAMLSSPLTAVAGKINQKQPGAVDMSALNEFKIGETRVVFIVHPSNPVKSLTPPQLKEILAGNITNWKEVGGLMQPSSWSLRPQAAEFASPLRKN